MAVALGGCGPSDPEPPAAFLDVLTGTTHLLPAGEASFVTATDGRSLDQGDRIRTAAGARAAVVFFEGSVVLMDGGADVTLELLQGSRGSGESEIGMFQSAGRTVHRVTRPVDAGSLHSLRTSSSVALVRGTGFIAEEDPVVGTRLKTFQGRVGVAGVTGVEVVVDGGRSTEASRGQDPTTPITEPLLPEEQDLIDVTENVIEENQVRPPPMKDPDVSTPVPAPTPAPVAPPTPMPGPGGGEPVATPTAAPAPVGPSPAGQTPRPRPVPPLSEAPGEATATPAPIGPSQPRATATPSPLGPSEPPPPETPAPFTPTPRPPNTGRPSVRSPRHPRQVSGHHPLSP